MYYYFLSDIGERTSICMHGGSCVDGIWSYSCNCPTGKENATNVRSVYKITTFMHVYSSFQISTSVHLTHASMVGHVLMVLGPFYVVVLLDTKAISVRSVRLCF